MSGPLSHHRLSLAHRELLEALAGDRNLLIIQDLDGVCMGLVRDPLRRQLSVPYIEACRRLRGRFFVLTNGEHIGARGVNSLVEAAFGRSSDWVREQGLYLPGLGAGGVQLQNRFGDLAHPGVSEREIEFLAAAPVAMRERMGDMLRSPPFSLPSVDVDRLLDIIVLDNAASPTANIGTLHDHLDPDTGLYAAAQREVSELMQQLLVRAEDQGLRDSFFIHLAPNLGAVDGVERLKPAVGADMGTTDFQFMLRGAIKEVGVLVLLNLHYHQQTGRYPLGADFNARSAPRERSRLLALAAEHFEPALMPRIVGVGDTLTSSADGRGGSDRGFLSLVQDLGQAFGTDNAVLFVDSSHGELRRAGIEPPPRPGDTELSLESFAGITDRDDALKLNFVFPGGHPQYIDFFLALASSSPSTDPSVR